MIASEKHFEDIKESPYLGEYRERIRCKLEFLLEELPKGIEKAKLGDTEAAAVYLSAIEKILAAALEEESMAYVKYVSKNDANVHHD